MGHGDTCLDPRPRINERNGRMFCATCRHYLDAPLQEPSGTLSAADPAGVDDPTAAQQEDPS